MNAKQLTNEIIEIGLLPPAHSLYIPAGKYELDFTSVFSHPLQNLVLDTKLRNNALRALRNYLIDLDRAIVNACYAFIATSTDEASITHKNAHGYLQDSIVRRPLYIAIHALEELLVNPNFLREFFILLLIFVQFENIAKKYVAPHTLQPVFMRYFGHPGFYSRFHAFQPGTAFRHSANQFVFEEFSHFLVCITYLRGLSD